MIDIILIALEEVVRLVERGTKDSKVLYVPPAIPVVPKSLLVEGEGELKSLEPAVTELTGENGNGMEVDSNTGEEREGLSR